MAALPIKMSASTGDWIGLARGLRTQRWIDAAPPRELTLDGSNIPTEPGWLEPSMRRCRSELFAAWDGDYESFVQYIPHTVLKVGKPGALGTPIGATSTLQALPFSIAAFAPLYHERQSQARGRILSPWLWRHAFSPRMGLRVPWSGAQATRLAPVAGIRSVAPASGTRRHLARAVSRPSGRLVNGARAGEAGARANGDQ